MESLFPSIIVAKYLNIFPHANNGRLREKTISGKAICSRHQRESALSRFGARVRYWIWLRGSASYVITNLEKISYVIFDIVVENKSKVVQRGTAEPPLIWD